MDAVQTWFAAGFNQLHPMLQDLHRHGGRLHGQIDIQYGRGLAGLLGKRFAAKFGLPLGVSSTALDVHIHSDGQALYWQRTFSGATQRQSVFSPVGNWPAGYWLEKTGAVQLVLAVQVIDGGWHWQPLQCRLFGVRIPLFCMPQVRAYKTIENSQYRFYVGVSLPMLGFLFSYSGLLSAKLTPPSKS